MMMSTYPALPLADFIVENEGTIFTVTPQHDAAQRHLKENVASDALWFGRSLCVEHRYVLDLVAALQDNGFAVA